MAIKQTVSAEVLDQWRDFSERRVALGDEGSALQLPDRLYAEIRRSFAKAEGEAERLEAIDAIVDAYIAYEPDQPGWDYWQTAHETLARGAGDCEDFAILKAEIAEALGYSAARLRLDVGFNRTGVPHAILVVDGRWALDSDTTGISTPAESGLDTIYSVRFDGTMQVDRLKLAAFYR